MLTRLNPRRFAVQALVLCPTRELADQVTIDPAGEQTFPQGDLPVVQAIRAKLQWIFDFDGLALAWMPHAEFPFLPRELARWMMHFAPTIAGKA